MDLASVWVLASALGPAWASALDPALELELESAWESAWAWALGPELASA